MKTSKGFSLVMVLVMMAIVGLIGFIGWRVWDMRNTKDEDSATKQTQTQESANRGGFESLPSEATGEIKPFSDGQKIVTATYPATWTLLEVSNPNGTIGTNANDVSYSFITPSNSLLSDQGTTKNGINLTVYKDVTEQLTEDLLGTDAKPESFTLDGKPAKYLKKVSPYYTDHTLIVINGSTGVTLQFREKQVISSENLITTAFDDSRYLPVFKAIGSSLKVK